MKRLPFQSDISEGDSSKWCLPDGALFRLGQGRVNDMTLSPDGTLLAIASSLGLWWYDVQKRTPLTLWDAGQSVYATTFSACGEWVATVSSIIKVYDVKSGKCLAELTREKGGGIDDIIFSPDRKRLVVGGSGQHRSRKDTLCCSVVVWKLQEESKAGLTNLLTERERTYVGTNPIAFSPDNRLLAFASPDGVPEPFHENGYPVIDNNWILTSNKVVVYEIATGQHVTTLEGFSNVGSINFSPCGQFIAACDINGTPRIREIPKQFSPDSPHWPLYKVYQEIDENGYHFISYAPDSRLINTVYALKDDTFSVLDLEGNVTLYKHTKETGYYHPDFSNGVRLAFESESEVHIWSEGEKHAVSLRLVTGVFPSSLKFSHDSKTLIARKLGGIFKWDVTQPQDLPSVFKPIGRKPDFDRLRDERCFSVDVSSEGKQFITSADENTLRLWKMENDTPIITFAIEAETYAAGFSPHANLIACGDETGRISIYDVATEKLHDTYYGDNLSRSSELIFSPNGSYLVCTPSQLYDVVRREQVDNLTDCDYEFQAFAPDNVHIWDTSGGDDEIKLWNIHRCNVVLSLPKPTLEPYETKIVEGFALSNCGQYLACSLYSLQKNSRLFVWNIHNGGTPIAIFEVPESNASLLAISEDRSLLASAGSSGSILLWDLKPYLNK